MNSVERFLWLAGLECNSLHLTKNDDNACNYVTAAVWIEDYEPGLFIGVPCDELQRMKDTNTIWRLQIYPNTPVGFVVFLRATAESVVDAAIEYFAAEAGLSVSKYLRRKLGLDEEVKG